MNTKNEQPFFARFLEGQFPNVKTGVKAGIDLPIETHKYPSDGDEPDPITVGPIGPPRRDG